MFHQVPSPTFLSIVVVILNLKESWIFIIIMYHLELTPKSGIDSGLGTKGCMITIQWSLIPSVRMTFIKKGGRKEEGGCTSELDLHKHASGSSTGSTRTDVQTDRTYGNSG
jgi:hypothetical protein